jgi:hypothetical protein
VEDEVNQKEKMKGYDGEEEEETRERKMMN